MRVKIWGVRGSIPCPGPHTVKYGGNTVCLEVRFPETDRLVIIDAGSGIRELGNFLMANDRTRGPINTEIYLTHTHWDHIMGFPFFIPAYLPDTRLRIHGPVSYEEDSLESIVGGQMTYRYFPVRQTELAADISYHDLKEGRRDLGDGIVLTTKYLNHPVLCLGYRFEHGGKVFCTAYDTEPFRNLFITDPSHPAYDEAMAAEGDLVAQEQNRLVEEFFAGADLLIHDSQYTEAEYRASKLGWGHSSFEGAIAAASRAGVKKLLLFHHEPVRTDAEFDRLAETYGRKDGPEVIVAREGMEISL
ncbi:MAG: MBL fold metallo-hydrolase [Desulfobacteraceae bacterium]|nr:MBL fold metallo-hydrolase [Desulfobacteraceae bacterium]